MGCSENLSPPVQKGFSQARDIIRKHAKTFYLGASMLPHKERLAIFTVYAVSRWADESVDDSRIADKEQRLEKIRACIEAAYGNGPLDNPLLEAYRKIVSDYRIPIDYFRELIEGMRMDLTKTRYGAFAELDTYCYRVAGVIGLITLSILGGAGQEAQKHAIDLGTAMQLTNIVRDIREDWERGRLYLPQEELARFGVSEEDIAAGRVTQNFKTLMRFQIGRARELYRRSQKGLKYLRGARARFVVLATQEMYARILSQIEHNHYDVFSRRACVSTAQRIFIIFKAVIGGKYLCR